MMRVVSVNIDRRKIHPTINYSRNHVMDKLSNVLLPCKLCIRKNGKMSLRRFIYTIDDIPLLAQSPDLAL